MGVHPAVQGPPTVTGDPERRRARGQRRHAHLGKHAAKQLEKHPRAASAVSRGQDSVAKGASKAGAKARDAAENMPEWGGTAVRSVRKTVGKVSRAGLSPKRVVTLHNKRGHNVTSLSDVRQLDLELVEKVRGRAANWHNPMRGGASGAGGPGLAITGGQLAITASAGAAAGASAGAIGRIHRRYRIRPRTVVPSRRPGRPVLRIRPRRTVREALHHVRRQLGDREFSHRQERGDGGHLKLTQALFRGKTWDVLSNAFVTKVAEKFAKAFGVLDLTKKSLAKAVPAFGIVSAPP